MLSEIINRIRIVELPQVPDQRGNLSFLEENEHVPFKIMRVYWIYDVPGGGIRGSHAFRETEELVIALSGSFDVVIYDGKEERKYHLNRSYYGLFLPPLTWRRLENFSTNSLALVLSSTVFREDDYIRDFNEYLEIVI